MSAKFTCGPWSSCVIGGAFEIEAESVSIARMYSFNAEANSRLIIAAPMLYEALEEVQWWGTVKDQICAFCGRSKESGHDESCIVGNALRAARGEG